MADAEKLMVLSLAEGITEGVAEEVAGGVITESRNTRLGVLKGTLSRRMGESALEATIFGNPVCGGLVPGPGGSTAAYFKPATQTRRILGSGVESDLSPVRAAGPQSAYFPYPVTHAASLPGSGVNVPPATQYDSQGRLWMASVRPSGTGWGVYLTVTLGDQTVISTRKVVTLTTALPAGDTLSPARAGSLWLGFTLSSGITTLWYAEDAGISAIQMQVNGSGQLVTNPAVSVYAPQIPNGMVDAADVVGDGSHVYLLTRDATTSTTVRVNKINALTLSSVSSVAFTSAVSTSASLRAYVALALQGTTLAVICSSSTTNTKYGTVDTSTMTGSLAGAFAQYGPVAVQPLVIGAGAWFIYAITGFSSNIVANPTRTTFIRQTLAGGGAGTFTLEWYALQSRGACHRVSDTEAYPYFPMLPWWTGNSIFDFPTERGVNSAPTERVIDPSVDIFTPFLYSSTFALSPIARVGVDRSSLPFYLVHNAQTLSVSSDGKLAVSYIERRDEQSYVSSEGFSVRWTELDLMPQHQPGYAVLPKGSALVAGALPGRWDGIETAEAGLLHTPRVVVATSGGSGSTLSGDFLVTAVISYRDATGETVRSAPALPFPVTLSAAKPIVYVTMPTSLRNGVTQEGVSVTLFWTLDAQTRFYASQAQPTSSGQGLWTFESIPTPSAADVPLYSDGTGGQELLPVCPPPARDARSISGRTWVIDAENNTVWPSKLYEPGVSPEFAAQLQVKDFDAQYGKLLAIVDVGGTPHVLAERGIYVIDGFGPDNVGRNGRFSVRLISSVGCRGRHTVAHLPGVGVMFQASDGRFMLLSAGSLKRFDTFGVYDVSAPAVFRASNEVVYPLASGTGWVVYDWVLDGWTHWADNATRPRTAACTFDGRAISYAPGQPAFYVMGEGTGLAGSMSAARGWAAPEAPNGDCYIREVWLHARNVAPHNLTITVSCDYDESGETIGGQNNTVTRTWLATGPKSLASITRDGKYTVAVTLQKPARAVKVTVEAEATEATGNGEMWHPLSLSIPYGVNAGIRKRTLLDGAKL